MVIRFQNGDSGVDVSSEIHVYRYFTRALFILIPFVYMKLTDDQIIYENITCTVGKKSMDVVFFFVSNFMFLAKSTAQQQKEK